MANSWQQPHTPAQGIALGPLVMIAAADRNLNWDLSAGTATAFTDAWTRAAIAPYVPAGVRALYLKFMIRHDDNSDRLVLLRKNGDTDNDNQQSTSIWRHSSGNADAAHSGYFTMLCDADGIVEYTWNAAATGRAFFLHVEGYYM